MSWIGGQSRCTSGAVWGVSPSTPKTSPPRGACAQPQRSTSSRARLVGARNTDPYSPADDGAAQPAHQRRAPGLDAPQARERLVIAVLVAVPMHQDHLAPMRGAERPHAPEQRIEAAR